MRSRINTAVRHQLAPLGVLGAVLVGSALGSAAPVLYPYVVVASSSTTTSPSPSSSIRAASPSPSASSGALPDTRSTGNVAYIEAGVGILFILALAGMASVLVRRRFTRL